MTLGDCRAATISRQTFWDTHGMSGNVFVNPTASSSSPYPGGFIPWISNVSEHTSPHVTSERRKPDTALDPRCQSEPSWVCTVLLLRHSVCAISFFLSVVDDGDRFKKIATSWIAVCRMTIYWWQQQLLGVVRTILRPTQPTRSFELSSV